MRQKVAFSGFQAVTILRQNMIIGSKMYENMI